jgi:putative ubiquitin-RnfH superfamily antitoxin RatB of RatAB toxin-antitoxin module
LEEKEIYCSIYNHLSKKQLRVIRNERVIITRNPCLDPADIRIVKCVGEEEIRERFEKKGMKNKYE